LTGGSRTSSPRRRAREIRRSSGSPSGVQNGSFHRFGSVMVVLVVTKTVIVDLTPDLTAGEFRAVHVDVRLARAN
jgi:hypothetical protein